MSAKVHLHMHVSDLAKSREFYQKFLGGDPVKVKQGYVKFLPEWAPVNLALSTGGHIGAGTIDHVGVQVDSVEYCDGAAGPDQGAGLPVVEEMGVNCCHANQDKFWVKDPDGSSGRCTTSSAELMPAPARLQPAWAGDAVYEPLAAAWDPVGIELKCCGRLAVTEWAL